MNVNSYNFLFDIRVSTHILDLLAAENIQPTGLFLETPFNNIKDELTEHSFAQVNFDYYQI